jgi:transcriptional regulator with XRE-family HTH domain
MSSAFGCLRCRRATSPPEIDIVLNLREARRRSGLTQDQAARLSGIHTKIISSFETGERIGLLKLSQLTKLLRVYGMTPAEFFLWSPDDDFVGADDARDFDARTI